MQGESGKLRAEGATSSEGADGVSCSLGTTEETKTLGVAKRNPKKIPEVVPKKRQERRQTSFNCGRNWQRAKLSEGHKIVDNCKRKPKQLPEVAAKKLREGNKPCSTAKGMRSKQSCQRIRRRWKLRNEIRKSYQKLCRRSVRKARICASGGKEIR